MRSENLDPVNLSEFDDNPKLMEEMSSVQHFLRDSKTEMIRKIIYSFRIKEIDTNVLKEKVELLYNELSCSAKVNLAFGSVLQNVHKENTFEYFYPADNNTIFPTPLFLSDLSDIAVIQNEIDRSKILESLISSRSDIKMDFPSVTNVSFIVYLLIDIPLACSQIHLAESLLRHKGIKYLLRDCNRKPYHVFSVLLLSNCLVPKI